MANFNQNDLDALHAAGLISPDTYNQAVSNQQAPADQIVQQYDPMMSKMSEAQQSTAPTSDIIPQTTKTPELDRLNASLALDHSVNQGEDPVEIAKAVASDTNNTIDQRYKSLNFLMANKEKVDAKKQFEDAARQREYEAQTNKINDFNQKAAALNIPGIDQTEVVKDEVKKQSTPTQTEIANASIPARMQQAAEQAQMQQVAARNADLQKADINSAKAVDEAKTSQDPDETESLGKKLLKALAIGLGAYSQSIGKTGINPALHLIDAEVKKKQEAKKLSQEQALATKKLLLDQAKYMLDLQNSQTENSLKKAQIAKIGTEINKEAQKTQAQLKIQMLASSNGLSDADLPFLEEKDMNRLVALPSGKYALAVNSNAAQNLLKYRADVEPAIDGARRILNKINDPSFSKLDLQDRAKISTEIKALAGQLRIPFTGPGALTEKEYERLMDTLGNPIKLLSVPELEKTKLRTVLGKLESDRVKNYEIAGIKLKSPVQQLDESIEKLKKRNPDFDEKTIRMLYNSKRKY